MRAHFALRPLAEFHKLMCQPGSDFYGEAKGENGGTARVKLNTLEHRTNPSTPDVPWIGGTRCVGLGNGKV